PTSLRAERLQPFHPMRLSSFLLHGLEPNPERKSEMNLSVVAFFNFLSSFICFKDKRKISGIQTICLLSAESCRDVRPFKFHSVRLLLRTPLCLNNWTLPHPR